MRTLENIAIIVFLIAATVAALGMLVLFGQLIAVAWAFNPVVAVTLASAWVAIVAIFVVRFVPTKK